MTSRNRSCQNGNCSARSALPSGLALSDSWATSADLFRFKGVQWHTGSYTASCVVWKERVLHRSESRTMRLLELDACLQSKLHIGLICRAARTQANTGIHNYSQLFSVLCVLNQRDLCWIQDATGCPLVAHWLPAVFCQSNGLEVPSLAVTEHGHGSGLP